MLLPYPTEYNPLFINSPLKLRNNSFHLCFPTTASSSSFMLPVDRRRLSIEVQRRRHQRWATRRLRHWEANGKTSRELVLIFRYYLCWWVHRGCFCRRTALVDWWRVLRIWSLAIVCASLGMPFIRSFVMEILPGELEFP